MERLQKAAQKIFACSWKNLLNAFLLFLLTLLQHASLSLGCGARSQSSSRICMLTSSSAERERIEERWGLSCRSCIFCMHGICERELQSEIWIKFAMHITQCTLHYTCARCALTILTVHVLFSDVLLLGWEIQTFLALWFKCTEIFLNSLKVSDK